ncbi:MAG: TonB family protein [Desulfuromonadaceae bacterium]|nr:TonB family protein [Desulfuromonadaceae bacterium]MDD5105016.1 TonB family protein [Desulfuromonadaceae bacterium]
MKTGEGGIAGLAPLLLASLLLHLAVLVAAFNPGRQETGLRQMSTNMVVEYLTGGKNEVKKQGTAPLQKTLPPVSRRTLAHGVMAASVPQPRQIPVAVRSVQQRASPPGVPVTRSAASAGATGLSIGREAETASSGPDPGAVIDRHAADSAIVTQQNNGTASAASSPLARVAYQEQLKRLIEAHKEYPLAARRSRREGSCQRQFILDHNGSLKHIESISSCGHPFLDEAATQAIAAVGTFPPLPDVFKGSEETFIITMTFTLAR